jgi:YbbR domain-containing protein
LRERLKNFLKGLLTQNISLKLLSILVALFLWAFVKGTSYTELTFFVPVKVTSLPPNLVLTDVEPQRLIVKVKGPAHKLDRLKVEDIGIFLDLKGAHPGLNTFLIRPEEVKVPSGIEVVGLSPSELRVKLSEFMRKVVPVKVQFKGLPPPSYEVISIKVHPPKVYLSGPKEVLEKIDHVTTEPIDLEDLKGSFKMEVPLALTGLEVEPSRVLVQVDLRRR